MRPAPQTIDTSGQDSFLDVIANLVGILLILIMVVGVRTRDAWKKGDAGVLAVMTPAGAAAAESCRQELEAKLAVAENQLHNLQKNSFELDRETKQVEAATLAEQQERDQLQFLVTAARQALTNAAATLNPQANADLDANKALSAAQDELSQLRAQLDATRAAAQRSEILEHYPTPLAKTVLGREEHFRLAAGHLAPVPLNEMIDQLKVDAENKLWKLQHVDEITESLPPQGGFRMRYTMRRYQRRELTENGPALRTTVELERFVLLPVDDQPGVPIGVALQEGSPFQRQLEGLSPSDTTITIWTYPDSFVEYRRLKDFLSDRGYQVAARPLPAGFPIGGSPDGNRSSAE